MDVVVEENPSVCFPFQTRRKVHDKEEYIHPVYCSFTENTEWL